MNSVPGIRYMNTIATVISDCIHFMKNRVESSVDMMGYPEDMGLEVIPSVGRGNSLPALTDTNTGGLQASNSISQDDSMVGNSHPSINTGKRIRVQKLRPKVTKVSDVSSVVVLEPVLRVVEPPVVILEETFEDPKSIMDINIISPASVMGIMASLFRSLECDDYLRLHPLKVQSVMQFYALPVLKQEDVQTIVNHTLIPKSEWVGFKRMCKYVTTHAHFICKTNKWDRLRILADIYFNPPLEEAKDIYLNHVLTTQKRFYTQEYRNLHGKAPKYLCNVCKERFPNEKLLEKHLHSGIGIQDHVRYHTMNAVYESEDATLKRARYLESNSVFPAYYELNDVKKLPKYYYPQVFDKMGEEGKFDPIGLLCVMSTLLY